MQPMIGEMVDAKGRLLFQDWHAN